MTGYDPASLSAQIRQGTLHLVAVGGTLGAAVKVPRGELGSDGGTIDTIYHAIVQPVLSILAFGI